MSEELKKSGLRQWLNRVFLRSGRGAMPAGESPGALHFRVMYERFREILSLNDALHQLISELEERLTGRAPFVLDTMLVKIRKAMLDVLIMVKDLNQISDNRYTRLYDALGNVNRDFEAECARLATAAPSGPIVKGLDEVGSADALQAGAKMANLGEVKNAVGLNVPDGFVVTTSAFVKFMNDNELWERANQLKRVLEMYSAPAIDKACRDVQQEILASPVPHELEAAILKAFDAMAGGRELVTAVRSSAVGEDRASSHAGQYYTELNVCRELLLDAYRQVLASSYRPEAVWYRFERGATDQDALMAVGCLAMVEPRASGLLFSRSFQEPAADRVELSVVPGLASSMVRGEQEAQQFVIGPGEHPGIDPALLSPAAIDTLYAAARRLEKHFGAPQDIEWAIDREDRLFILQTRPLTAAIPSPNVAPGPSPGVKPLLEGGHLACPGAATGPVFALRSDADLEKFVAGSVAVARHSSPAFARIMTRTAAIVTDVGSPIGHMAILAREFGVPAIVGLEGASTSLQQGQVVTVDASSCRVYDGEFPIETRAGEHESPLAGSPAVAFLRRVAPLVVPLHLIDPASSQFTPANCRSLHDVTRFVHEKVYETMFFFGDRARRTEHDACLLEANLPIRIRVLDVGGGVREGAGAGGRIQGADLVSGPMMAFMAGMEDPRIRWNQPRPLSAKGFLSVIGQNMAGPPAESTSIGTVSYAVVSDRYLNFSTKAGYHFSTVDAYCGKSQNKNYIHFRFAGGGASSERRARRVQFLSEVLSSLDFKVQPRGDLLIAQFQKYEEGVILDRLTVLGRLTMCSRQLDMLMDKDGSPRFFAGAFLSGDFSRF